jgi:hypothetical protein
MSFSLCIDVFAGFVCVLRIQMAISSMSAELEEVRNRESEHTTTIARLSSMRDAAMHAHMELQVRVAVSVFSVQCSVFSVLQLYSTVYFCLRRHVNLTFCVVIYFFLSFFLFFLCFRSCPTGSSHPNSSTDGGGTAAIAPCSHRNSRHPVRLCVYRGHPCLFIAISLVAA